MYLILKSHIKILKSKDLVKVRKDGRNEFREVFISCLRFGGEFGAGVFSKDVPISGPDFVDVLSHDWAASSCSKFTRHPFTILATIRSAMNILARCTVSSLHDVCVRIFGFKPPHTFGPNHVSFSSLHVRSV